MQILVGGGNAILLLLTALFLGLMGMIVLLASKRRNRTILRPARTVAGIVVVIYGGLLLGAAGVSRERTIGRGEIKWFCGFYIDCHLGVSVARVESAKIVQTGNGPLVAKGLFRIVTLELHNSARNPDLDMTLYEPRAAVVDARGARYQRNRDAERAVARDGIHSTALPDRLAVSHKPAFAILVFDLPADTENPRLAFEEGFVVDRVIELVLINDDNSMLHKPTLLALAAADAAPPTSDLISRPSDPPRARLASR